MQLTVKQALKKAFVAQAKGELKTAESIYRVILRKQPGHAEANHNLGVILASDNKFDEALPFFKVAVDSSPKAEQFWVSYIE
ncbi:MAG: hypothetical protein P8K27_06825, partial [Gammaproteobacteria bacterium]|nr:hypothetical protein [Gammaproteobacteria bacterium]